MTTSPPRRQAPLPHAVAIATALTFIVAGMELTANSNTVWFLFTDELMTTYLGGVVNIIMDVVGLVVAALLAAGAVRALYGRNGTLLIVGIATAIANGAFEVVRDRSYVLFPASGLISLLISVAAIGFALSPQSTRWFRSRTTETSPERKRP